MSALLRFASILVVVLSLASGTAGRGADEENAPSAPQPDPSLPKKSAEPPPEAPWLLEEDIKVKLARTAEVYREYALRFACTEIVRVAKYGDSGEADRETTRRYSYLLERESGSETLHELRQKTRGDGAPKGGEVQDEEPFPPAYGWVFLFSTFHQPYFAYRDRGDRFEGFDWVREVEFKGALPFTDGKDIRQWQGTVLVDAVTNTPIEIEAEPSGQADRIRALFDRWAQAFSLIGVRLAPRPFGYKCHVRFHTRKDSLTFPTQLRYDTFRAVSSTKNVPWQASIRDYQSYVFFKTQETEGVRHTGAEVTPGDDEETDPVVLPVEDSLDLHTFERKDVRDVVASFLDAAIRAGFREVRLIHGRGVGVQREIVRSLLSRHPRVVEFFDAPPERGGWGATVVRLRPDLTETEPEPRM